MTGLAQVHYRIYQDEVDQEEACQAGDHLHPLIQDATGVMSEEANSHHRHLLLLLWVTADQPWADRDLQLADLQEEKKMLQLDPLSVVKIVTGPPLEVVDSPHPYHLHHRRRLIEEDSEEWKERRAITKLETGEQELALLHVSDFG